MDRVMTSAQNEPLVTGEVDLPDNSIEKNTPTSVKGEKANLIVDANGPHVHRHEQEQPQNVVGREEVDKDVVSDALRERKIHGERPDSTCEPGPSRRQS